MVGSLQPDSYLGGEKLQPVRMPDLRSVVGDKYELYDSGGFGELDVRAFLKQFGEKKAATELSPSWQGGAYVAFRRVSVRTPETPVTPADIALVYVSRWTSADAAQKFAKVYASGIAKRYSDVHENLAAPCSGKQCPVMIVDVITSEGPVIIEQWKDNQLVIQRDSTRAPHRNFAMRS